MLQDYGRHLIQRPWYKPRNMRHDHTSYHSPYRTTGNCRTEETAVFWTLQRPKTSYSEMEGAWKAEEKMGRQHKRMDRAGVCSIRESSWEQREMEEAGCWISAGAPMTPLDGWSEVCFKGLHINSHATPLSILQIVSYCRSLPSHIKLSIILLQLAVKAWIGQIQSGWKQIHMYVALSSKHRNVWNNSRPNQNYTQAK